MLTMYYKQVYKWQESSGIEVWTIVLDKETSSWDLGWSKEGIINSVRRKALTSVVPLKLTFKNNYICSSCLLCIILRLLLKPSLQHAHMYFIEVYRSIKDLALNLMSLVRLESNYSLPRARFYLPFVSMWLPAFHLLFFGTTTFSLIFVCHIWSTSKYSWNPPFSNKSWISSLLIPFTRIWHQVEEVERGESEGWDYS